MSIVSFCLSSTERYPSRWLILAASLVFLVMSGLAYAFALISETLKDRLVLTQSEVASIAILGTVGANSGVIAGLFNNRFGPQISIRVGIAITCIGYGLLAVITTQYWPIQSVALACFANFLFNHGTAWYCTVSLPLLAQNFPEQDHGKLLGLGKGFMGIGSAFIAAFKADFAGGDVELFMKSTMAFLVVASLVYSRFLVLLPPKMTDVYSPNEIKWGNLSIALWYIVSFGFAIYLVALAMVQTIYDFDQNIRYILFGVAVFLWFLPTLLALLCHGDVSMKYEGYKSSSVEGAPSVNDWSSSVNSIEPVVPKKRSTHKNSDVGMPDIFRYWQLYVIYAVCTLICGVAITFMDNTPQIIESALSDAVYDVENETLSTSVIVLTAFGSFTGRVVGGFLVDYFASKCHCSIWLIVPPLIMTLTKTALFFSGTNMWALRIGGFFVGMSFGWIFSLIVVLVVDLWGLTYLSGNFSLFDSSVAVGGAIFSTRIFAKLYEQFAWEERERIEYFSGLKCYGSDCYKWTFLICACSSFVALILSVINWRCTPKKRKRIEGKWDLKEQFVGNETSKFKSITIRDITPSVGDQKEDLMMFQCNSTGTRTVLICNTP